MLKSRLLPYGMNFKRSYSSFHTDLCMIVNEKCNNPRIKRYLSILWSWFLQATKGTGPILYWVKSVIYLVFWSHIQNHGYLLGVRRHIQYHTYLLGVWRDIQYHSYFLGVWRHKQYHCYLLGVRHHIQYHSYLRVRLKKGLEHHTIYRIPVHTRQDAWMFKC
jgi:hypothetical protein